MTVKRLSILIAIAISLISWNCRKQLEPTEVEMTEYGWVLYANGDYLNSNDWFQEAVFTDSTYKDGFNGLGWTHGKLGQIQQSIVNFNLASPLENDVNLLGSGHNTTQQVIAGLAMAKHANNQHAQAIISGDSLLAVTGDDDYSVNLGDPNWIFSRDTKINSKHIIWVLSSSHFVQGNFDKSLSRVHQLMSDPLTFAPDVNTVEGRLLLAEKIEFLRDNL